MLYLISGANGAGKTLNTLKWVRERQLKENRPVCHNGRFEPVPGGELDGWKKIDFKDWQSEPDGTIFLIDEAHNDLPNRPAGSTVPEAVKMLAEHRRRGFDFYMVTQHPQNIDSFVRRLIGPPGWHRHLKRSFGVDMVSVLEWSAVNPNCEKDGSGKSGTATMQAFPKEVYGWYKSASLHTGKKRIPKAVWMLGACAILVPALGYFAITSVYGNVTKHAKPATKAAGGEAAAPGQTQQAPLNRKPTVDEYLKDRMARLPDFPHTAPAYDDVTKPTEAPYPAACVTMGKTCKCYSQQATLLQVSGAVCLQIVQQGFFVDWKSARGEYSSKDRMEPPQRNQLQQGQQQAHAEPVRTVPMPMPAAKSDQVKNEYMQGLAARNAQVRSELQ